MSWRSSTDELVELLRATDVRPPNGDRRLREMFLALLFWVRDREELVALFHTEAARRWRR